MAGITREENTTRHWLAASALAFALVSPALSAETAKDFATAAAKDGLAEVALGKLTLEKAADPAVKRFANRMIDDHGTANTELKRIAAAEKIALPSEPGEKLQEPLAKLSGLEGARFDSAYIDAMVEDHEKSVDLFENYQKNGDNKRLQEFAGKTHPILEEHLRQARSIQSTLPGARGGTTEEGGTGGPPGTRGGTMDEGPTGSGPIDQGTTGGRRAGR